MKFIINLITILLICNGHNLWGQYTITEVTQTTGVNVYTSQPYISTCNMPEERVFKLKIYKEDEDDDIKLDRVFFNGSNCSNMATITSPTSAVNAGNNGTTNSGVHYEEFTIKTEDKYVNHVSQCWLAIDYTYTDNTNANVVPYTNVTVMAYDVRATMTAPTLENYKKEKACGKIEVIPVHIEYENDLDNYTITVTNGQVVPGSEVLNNTVACRPKLDFEIETSKCGDVRFSITRNHNAPTSRTDNYTIRSTIAELGTIGGIETFYGTNKFCIQNGPTGAILLAPTNTPIFGNRIPSLSDVQHGYDQCGFRGTWSILPGSTSMTGITLRSANGKSDLVQKFIDIHQIGVYVIKYTFTGCDGTVERIIQLDVCDLLPGQLPNTPPIDLQYICTLGEGPTCATIGVNGGCINQINIVNNNDPKLLVNSTGNQLCLGSIFNRRRTSQLTLNTSNACGTSNTVTWNILVDYPEHCTGNSRWQLSIHDDSRNLNALLEPQSPEYSSDEEIQTIELFNISGQLMFSQLNVNSNMVEIPSNNLDSSTPYVIRVTTNQNVYTKQFIKK